MWHKNSLFKKVSILLGHSVVHEGLKKYKCNKCGKSFGYASYLKQHNEAIHEGLKRYKCDKCLYSCSDGSNLRKHIKGVHEGQNGKKIKM